MFSTKKREKEAKKEEKYQNNFIKGKKAESKRPINIFDELSITDCFVLKHFIVCDVVTEVSNTPMVGGNNKQVMYSEGDASRDENSGCLIIL